VAGRGRSTYRGLRVTLTQPVGGDTCVVSVSVKREADGWDEWSLLFPSIRLETGPLTSSLDAAEVVGEAVSHVMERLRRE
jgi:hypothetical protein